MKKDRLLLRIRTYPAGSPGCIPWADVWLVQASAEGAEHGLMHGQLSPPRAEALAAALADLGIVVEREERPFEFDEAPAAILASGERKRLTPAEQLTHPCPRCQVGPGEKCRNYRGQGKQPCPGRGRPVGEAPAGDPGLFDGGRP